jgi:hypothetical protein
MIETLIQANDRIAQAEGSIVSEMGKEKVMLSIANGKYYNLGELGGEIWDLLSSPMTLQELVEQLLARYEVERSECEQQVQAFLGQLVKEKLIEVAQAG